MLDDKRNDAMILVPYDGSADAQAAIDHAAQLLPGAKVTVVTVWEPYFDMLARSGSAGWGMGGGGSFEGSEDIDASTQAAALRTATDGALRATDAGLVATPRCATRDGDIATTILGVAADVDADLIVLGTRGRGGMTSFLLGSVSHSLVQHADRPVMVVPSEAIAAQRRQRVHHDVVDA
jgi:nucleotide-binding universal stress UspA family protein